LLDDSTLPLESVEYSPLKAASPMKQPIDQYCFDKVSEENSSENSADVHHSPMDLK
jgi:hypothetical protein